MTEQTEPKCRICGRGLQTGLRYFPDPLLPGDLPAKDELCMDCQAITDTDAEMRVERCRCLVDVETERIGLHFSPKDDELLCPTLTDDGWRRLLADICEDENLTITYRRGVPALIASGVEHFSGMIGFPCQPN